jgi:hypothetical protein
MVKKVTKKTEEELSNEPTFADFLDDFAGDIANDEEENLLDHPDAEQSEDDRISSILSVPQRLTDTPTPVNNGTVMSLGIRDNESGEMTYYYAPSVIAVPIESLTTKFQGGRKLIGGRSCWMGTPPELLCGSSNGVHPWLNRIGTTVGGHIIGLSIDGDPVVSGNICGHCPLKDWHNDGNRKIPPTCKDSWTWILYVPEQEWFIPIETQSGEWRVEETVLPGRIVRFKGRPGSVQLALQGRRKGSSGALKGDGAIPSMDSFNTPFGSITFDFSGEIIRNYQKSIMGYVDPEGNENTVFMPEDVPEEAYGNPEFSFRLTSSKTKVYPNGKPTIARDYESTGCYPVIFNVRENNLTTYGSAFVPYPTLSETPLTLEEYQEMLDNWKNYVKNQRPLVKTTPLLEDVKTTVLQIAATSEENNIDPIDENEDLDVFDAEVLDD